MDSDSPTPRKKYEQPWTETGAPRPPDVLDLYRWLRDQLARDRGEQEPPEQVPPVKDLREEP